MSVIASLCLRDGIILAADSRLTRYNKYTEGRITKKYDDSATKIFRVKNQSIGIMWCGAYEINNSNIPDFITEFDESILINDTIERVAYKLNAACIGKYRDRIKWHISGYENDEQYVFQIVDDVVTRKNIDPGTGKISICMIWDGIRNITSKYIKNDIPILIGNKLVKGSDAPKMTLEEGTEFVKAILLKTCEEDDSCERPIDILVIQNDKTKWIDYKIK